MSRLIPGSPVIWRERRWVLVDIPAIDRALIRDPVSGSVEIADVDEIKADLPPSANNHGLMTISDEEWSDAWNRFQAIRPLLDRGSRQRTNEEVEAVARALGKDRATVYRWIAKWEQSKTVSALLRSGRSDAGKSRLSDETEAIIRHEIDTFYLVRERPTVVELWERVALACRAKSLHVPNLSTIRRRVDRLPDRLSIAKRFSPKMARETFEPIRGAFPGADVPLAVYQIDHTPIDVSLVDDKYRQPIGRGYLTIVVDSCTRMLAGFCASLDPPGALATGLAMAHAILPKNRWLAEREIDASWPIHGIPAKVYADNAAEFRGTMLERACSEHGIIIENRPKGQPNYGGHVERLFRTFMKRTQSLPGSTFSNVEQRGEYDSDGRAVMTLSEYTRWFTIFVTKVYHHRPHSGIGRVPPVKLYEQFILGTDLRKGIGLPEPIADEFKLRMDFMPFVDRTIQEYGVVIDNIHYYADVLRPWIHARDPHNPKLKRKFVFVRDPRDIGEVYFLDPDTKTYYPIPYRDLTRPRMSVWELNAILKYISEHPELQADEDTIFEGLAEMHSIRSEASEKSRKVRRQHQRRSGWKTGAEAGRQQQSLPEPEGEQWGEDVQPFDDIEEAE
ncbi:helix-turn-helix domain-containing protein [Ralstonia sp. AU12-08]|uniref:helix-turn-helix domain-containing protein n=1 Tax=Ralstonia sp. AU12-08 TaxID=1235457 RepID=UPI0004CF6354|nr:Mu transposase C-terminal domain-containing protein [Ralstonia sp. AU12-08]